MSFPGGIVQWRKGPESLAPQSVHHKQKNSSYLFYGQLFESRQRAREEAHYKGGRGADNIQHGGREHGDVRMLPGEGVEQSHYCMTTLRQCAAEKEKEKG